MLSFAHMTQHDRTAQDGHSATVFEWQSVGTFVDDIGASSDIRSSSYAQDGHRESWKGNESFDDSLALARKGRTEWATLAEEVYDILEAGGIELEVHQWAADRAGAFPCVPDYIAGVPENMRRRLTHANDASPINVVVDITASAAFNAKQLVKRGAACLALCIALQQHRAVTLYLSCGLDKGSPEGGRRWEGGNRVARKANAQFTVMKLDTVPMDLSQLAYLFGSPGFMRGVCMAVADKMGCGYDGMWPWSDPMDSDNPGYIQRCKDVLALAPQDLYIPPICSANESVTNPLTWIQGHLDKYAQHIDD